MLRRSLFALATFTVVAIGCGGSSSTFPEDAVADRVNLDIALGTERILLAVSQLDGTRLGSPDKAVNIEVAPDEDPSQSQRAVGAFTWAIPEVTGFYRAVFDFDRPGLWQVTVFPESGEPLETILIQVSDDACRLPDAGAPCAPRVGEQAPSLATPTLENATLADLTTDPDPDEAFYQLSLDTALTNGRPSVIVFATPVYCRSATCGPILANVKSVAGEYPDVDFVHIEVYTGLQDPDFAPDPAHLSPAIELWTLPSEPWVFVTDGAGVITARFEGVLEPAELRDHL